MNQKMRVKRVRPFGLRDKFGYLFGDLGNDFFFMLVSSYLMVFYTDIFGISAAVVGVLFMVARLWDAVADVTWGRFIDTRKTTPNGKFKPWIFRMSFPLVITGVLMFVKFLVCLIGFYMVGICYLYYLGNIFIVQSIFLTVQWLLLSQVILLNVQHYPLGEQLGINDGKINY